MIAINSISKPILTNYDNNIEYFIYIKYKWGDENCIPDKFVICPPTYGEWKQLVNYLGYNLKPNEMDLIYGGFKDSIVHMIDILNDYFEDLKKNKIIEYYLFDVKYNDMT